MEHSILNSGMPRSVPGFSPDELRIHQEKFLTNAKNILLLQDEIIEMQECLDNLMEAIQKRQFQDGEVVDFENVIVLKRITDELRPKRKALNKQIRRLYWDLFPGDIYIDQHFFETWISLKPDWVVRFSYDLEKIEMMQQVESATS